MKLRGVDAARLIEKACCIRLKKGGIKLIHLYEWQKELLKELSTRNIILKARQIGMSTVSCALLYLRTIFFEGVNTKIVANKKEIAQVLLDTIAIIHNSIPEHLRPPCKHESRFEFFFERNNSRLSIAASTKDVGRGETIHNLLCSEVAFWEQADEAMMGLLECVPKDGLVIVESTPNGIGNWFYDIYNNAQDKGFKPFIYSWAKHPEYDKDWADQKRKEIGKLAFAQEYDCDFVHSGQGIFVEELEGITVLQPIETKAEANYVMDIYEKPEKDGQYVLGCDSSGGYPDGDKACFYIINSKTRKTALRWHGCIAPDKLGTEVMKYAKEYNNAYTGIEVNNHGLTTINAIKDDYPELYFRERRDRVTNEKTRELGWLTTDKSKDEIIDYCKKSLRDKDVTELPKELIREMRTFVRKENGKIEAQDGCHDDEVMAYMIALFMVGCNPYWEIPDRPRSYMGRPLSY